ncbi:SDR family oxidoreductase [Sphingopyxis terrae]|uniref:SDR family oxidoreductase n=1 Tax=Sphingopyxis terrae TaxID=33052 RepID=UPI002A1523ED|nr:SDR family oxidoreductase [Sphingopyxis terrae]MDX8356503.1 SDR family oxidoreductase [Sphingopyxis terrae]
MDLGLRGKTAIICGSTSGLGLACAEALAAADATVLINGRRRESVEAITARLSERLGRLVEGVAADVTTDAGRRAIVERCPAPDILVCNSAGPPPGRIDDWGYAEWEKALGGNMISPILLIRDVLPGMRKRRWGRIINITSAAVKAPLPMLGLSNGARSGLTGFVAGLAREVAADGVTINNLLPGNFATRRLQQYADALGRDRGTSAEAVLADLAAQNPTRRVGDPEEFGAACAFLASQHAGYITGQNFLMDGGAYPGTF